MLSPLGNAQPSGHPSCCSGGRLDTLLLSRREQTPAPEIAQQQFDKSEISIHHTHQFQTAILKYLGEMGFFFV